MKFLNRVTKSRAVLLVTISLLFSQFSFAADAPIHVNIDNFTRAETDMQSARLLAGSGGVNKLLHFRMPYDKGRWQLVGNLLWADIDSDIDFHDNKATKAVMLLQYNFGAMPGIK